MLRCLFSLPDTVVAVVVAMLDVLTGWVHMGAHGVENVVESCLVY